MVEAIRRLKSGRRVIHTTHDPFLGVPDGIPVKVDVEVDTQPSHHSRRSHRQPRLSALRAGSHRVDPHQRCVGGNL
jgi:hypothetical protein